MPAKATMPKVKRKPGPVVLTEEEWHHIFHKVRGQIGCMVCQDILRKIGDDGELAASRGVMAVKPKK